MYTHKHAPDRGCKGTGYMVSWQEQCQVSKNNEGKLVAWSVPNQSEYHRSLLTVYHYKLSQWSCTAWNERSISSAQGSASLLYHYPKCVSCLGTVCNLRGICTIFIVRQLEIISVHTSNPDREHTAYFTGMWKWSSRVYGRDRLLGHWHEGSLLHLKLACKEINLNWLVVYNQARSHIPLPGLSTRTIQLATHQCPAHPYM